MGKLFITLGILFALFILLVIISNISYHSDGQSYERAQLRADVRISVNGVFIRNLDDFHWENVSIEIIPGRFNYNYQGYGLPGMHNYRHGRLPSNRYDTISWMGFSDRKSVRFDYIKIKPQRIIIRAETPKGRAKYEARFN